MEVSESLLVAMMFVMILSIGIGNILMGLAGILHRGSEIRVHWMPLAWVVVLLLTHLELFWQTLSIVSVESWRFGGFLYIVTGPVALLFATSLMLPDSARAAAGDYRAHYFSISRRFFGLLAVVMLWMIGVDLGFEGGMTPAGVWNLLQAGVLVGLAVSQVERFHELATIATVGLLLADLVTQGVA